MIAEGFARRKGIEADSAGTEATGPIFDEVKELVESYDLEDYVDYNPEQVDQEKLDWADKVICMTENQEKFVSKIYGFPESKIDNWGIEDADPGENLESVVESLFRNVENFL